MKKIQWCNNRGGLNEAFSSGLQFALVSPDYRQCCQFVFCKDYLHAAFAYVLQNNVRPVYGFDYKPPIDPVVGFDKIRLIVVNKNDAKLRERIPNCLDFLRQFELKLGIVTEQRISDRAFGLWEEAVENGTHTADDNNGKRYWYEAQNQLHTTAEECEGPAAPYKPGGAWLFEGSDQWIIAPPMISLYALAIRTGMGHVIGQSIEQTIDDILEGRKNPYMPVDLDRLTRSRVGIDYITKHGYQRVFSSNIRENYPFIDDIQVFHSNFGIVGFTNGVPRSYAPAWYALSPKTQGALA